jgi:hypothetical protein
MPCLSSTLIKETPSAAICGCRLLAWEGLQGAVLDLGNAIGVAIGVAIGLSLAPGSYHVEMNDVKELLTKTVSHDGGWRRTCVNRASEVTNSSVRTQEYHLRITRVRIGPWMVI